MNVVYLAIINRFQTFFYDDYDDMLRSWNWNRVSSWMPCGWTNECFEVLYGRCCVRREPGLWLTAIVWIARLYTAYWTISTKLNYEVFGYVRVNHGIKLDYACGGEILEKKVFYGLK